MSAANNPNYWGMPYSWEEVEEDRYRYNEGLGLCELDRTSPPTDVQHHFAIDRVMEARRRREFLKLWDVEVLS